MAPCGVEALRDSRVVFSRCSSVGRASVIGSSPVPGWAATTWLSLAVVAQLVERVLGKDEVTSSILVNGSRNCEPKLVERPIRKVTSSILVNGSRICSFLFTCSGASRVESTTLGLPQTLRSVWQSTIRKMDAGPAPISRGC